MRFFIPVFFVVVLVQGFPVHAQDTLRGKVVDEANVPISWAYIISEEGVIVSATDSAGVFRMPYSAKPDTLMVQKFGFKKKPFPTNQEFITIQMEEEVRELPEVVVGQDFEDYLLDQYFEKREDNYLSTEEMGPYSLGPRFGPFKKIPFFPFWMNMKCTALQLRMRRKRKMEKPTNALVTQAKAPWIMCAFGA